MLDQTVLQTAPGYELGQSLLFNGNISRGNFCGSEQGHKDQRPSRRVCEICKVLTLKNTSALWYSKTAQVQYFGSLTLNY